jgi:hypothetical protein
MVTAPEMSTQSRLSLGQCKAMKDPNKLASRRRHKMYGRASPTIGYFDALAGLPFEYTKADDGAGMFLRRTIMRFGTTMWFTEYSISPSELAIAAEERG